MAVQHNVITDPNIHEPKGASTASAGQVYVADGAGSGNWRTPGGGDYAEIYITGGTVATALPAASAYTKINPQAKWQAGESSGATSTPANGELVLTNAGTYLIEFWCAFDTAAIAAGAEYYFKYGVNGALSTRILSTQKNTAGVDRVSLAAHGIIVATAGTLLTIHVAGDGTSSGTDMTVIDSGLAAILIKGA